MNEYSFKMYIIINPMSSNLAGYFIQHLAGYGKRVMQETHPKGCGYPVTYQLLWFGSRRL